MVEDAAFTALVSGRVQGVGFRWATSRAADRCGAHGWVANLPDGRVAAWIEGPAEAGETMRQFLGRGPALARVDELECREVDPRGYGRFDIRNDVSGFEDA